MQLSAAVQDTLLATASKGHAARDISSLATQEAIRVLATEIDRTILPCRLRAQFGDRISVFFLVRNRRLHGIKSNDDQTLPTEFNDGNLSADGALDLVRWISDLCDTIGLTRIERDRILPEDDMTSLGVSPARLSLATGLDLSPVARPNLQERLQVFIDAHPSRIRTAFLMADDEVSVIHGSSDVVDQHTEMALDILGLVTTNDTPVAGLLETEGVLVLPHPHDADGTLIVAGSLGLVCLVVVSSTTMLDAFHGWQTGRIVGT